MFLDDNFTSWLSFAHGLIYVAAFQFNYDNHTYQIMLNQGPLPVLQPIMNTNNLFSGLSFFKFIVIFRLR